ncbi:MAG: hypothetical protein H7Z10_03680 [Gemmatimonadaceae bacterium]|nr:hypothetical protein [Acetobacteraceae bacterium]
MSLSAGALSRECRAALSRAFMRHSPDSVLDARGYMADPRQNLVEGVSFADIEGDILQGDGSELRGDGRGRPPKFLAAHSSTALAVNVFGPGKTKPQALRLPWGGPFTGLRFERKCPHGVGNGKPPNLDVLLDGPGGVIGIESKCLEAIGDHKAEFRPAYDADVRGARRETPWFREIARLTADAGAYRRLNAAQLLKHALGLAFSFPDRSTTLAYVFWEPSNAAEHPLFSEHRAELNRFAAAVAGGGPDFVWMSYPDLWTWWDGLQDAPDWLGPHVMRLRERCDVIVDRPIRSRP